jgi:flagellar L-ring protein precursor FlgH
VRAGILLILIVLGLTGVPASSAAQDALPDSASMVGAPGRASWVSDRVNLHVGDIVTVLIDEQTAARERVTQMGTTKRSLRAQLAADANGEEAVGATGIEGTWDGNSKDVGEANRQGNLIGVVSARVIDIDRGVAEIKGEKTVTVDGREQIMTLHGFVRPEDVSPTNHIFSGFLADASITYKGKKMGAKTGILGKILSIIWPF